MTPPSSHVHSQPLLALAVALLLAVATTARLILAEPATGRLGCRDKCGDISIPFPFGIGHGCFRQGFEVLCNDSARPPRAFIAGSERIKYAYMGSSDYFPLYILAPNVTSPLELVNISVATSEARAYGGVSYQCSTNETFALFKFYSMALDSTPFAVSGTHNVLIGVGWRAVPELTIYNSTSGLSLDNVVCSTDGADSFNGADGSCMGQGCCEKPFPSAYRSATHALMSFLGGWDNPLWENYPCEYGMLTEKTWYNFSMSDMYGYMVLPSRFPQGVPLVLDFAIGNTSCPAEGEQPPSDYACVSGNSSCADATSIGRGYVCKCLDHYDGNPYIPNGCQDIDECKFPELYPCSSDGICKNRLGGYDCPCKFGMKGDGKAGTCTAMFPLAAKVTVGLAALVIVLLLIVVAHQLLKLKRLYKQNGGEILEGIKNIRIYTKKQLKKMTSNYKTVIGKGHFGEVYSGTDLKEKHSGTDLKEKQQVAVKRSFEVDKASKKEFTDEVILQSGMRHKNIVRLLGCCLETEVPMLVYEFVKNGSLYDALFENRDSIPVDTRLRIAIGSAAGLTYMHSSVERRIRHGDVKSGNILLDENFAPKISDFGTSRFLAKGKDEKAVLVTGDKAYIDPEYMANGTLTQKSDVYSFGIVLVELITRRRATYDEKRSYVANFVHASPEERARELFDKDITSEKDIDLLEKVSEIVVKCVKPKPEERLDMKQVEIHLSNIIGQVEVVRRETSGSTISIKCLSPTWDEVPLLKAGKNEAPRD